MPTHDQPHVAHHFESAQQQAESGKLGMWLFLSTEILLFGGLFCAYAVYRANHPDIFIYAHQFLSKTLGGVNTLVLICSSFTMAWAVRAAQLGQRKRLVVLLSLTLVCAFMFLGIKGVEYKHKWHEGLLWGTRYAPKEHGDEVHGAEAGLTYETAQVGEEMAPPSDLEHEVSVTTAALKLSDPALGEERTLIVSSADGPGGLAPAEPHPAAHRIDIPEPKNVQIFFGVYFVMTGLHALHVIAGMVVIGWLLRRSVRGDFGPRYFAPVDLGGLYWHLVDLIWIYLFPLLYLIH